MKINNQNSVCYPVPARQKGMVLILVLSLLVALTILGVSSMSTSTLETKMANNFQDRNAAFQAAEAALREGERLVESSNFDGSQFDNQCTNG
ncbi:MAG: PilX N-terminal domain-containing pilus assembly protein, partial [Gammaproteobacteria bacterium]|nr:PilX N-terminal domain-containing pilus assembly protein [Gammaproteobacteria bacterium]